MNTDMLNMVNKHENDKALVLLKTIKSLERKCGELIKEIREKRVELEKICTHNEVITEKSFVDGDYYSRAEHITTTTCKICGVELDKQVKYGGFG